MKRIVLCAFFLMAGVSTQVSALCMYMTHNYSGIVAGKTDVTAYGPFAITDSNGCSQASINAKIEAAGSGSPPEIYIDRLQGSAWVQVAGSSVNKNPSHVGPLGTYRIRVKNDSTDGKAYGGNIRYGR